MAFACFCYSSRSTSIPATKGPLSNVSVTRAVVGRAMALNCVAALTAWALLCIALGLGRSKLKVFLGGASKFFSPKSADNQALQPVANPTTKQYLTLI